MCKKTWMIDVENYSDWKFKLFNTILIIFYKYQINKFL